MPAPRLLHWFESALYFPTSRLIRLLPHPVASRLGRAAGALAFLVLPKRRRTARVNLERALPHLTPRERARVARESFVHFSAVYWETISAVRFSAEEIMRRVEFEGLEHLDRAAASGKGFFLLGAHYGVGDLVVYPLSQRVGPIHVVARRLRNPSLDREIRNLRRKLGMRLIERKGAACHMLETVRQAGRVAVTIDQRVRPEDGFLLPFMGRPAWTSRILGKLAVRTGLPVLPVYCRAEGPRMRLTVEPPITPRGGGLDEEISLTRRYLESLERHVRERPELWLWHQRRWQRTDRLRYGSRFEGLARESQLPEGSSAQALNSTELPEEVRNRLRDLAGGAFLEGGQSLLFEGPREQAGRTARGLGQALVTNGYPVAYRRTPRLAEELARARDAGRLTQALIRLDRYPLLILDDADMAAPGRQAEALSALLEHRQWKLSILFVRRPVVGFDRALPQPLEIRVTTAEDRTDALAG